MATFKKTAKKGAARKASARTSSRDGGRRADAQAQAEQLSRTLSESAHQVWLAGVGAFGRAQSEGTKLFEGLVKEGLNLERSVRNFANGRAGEARSAVEQRVDQARDRAADTWDRLEKVFEDRVQRALVKLGVPGRDDLAELNRRVEALTAELRRQGATPARKPARKAPAAAPARAAKATKAASARKAAPARAPRKSAARKSPARPASRRTRTSN